jgi:hypothetical protein
MTTSEDLRAVAYVDGGCMPNPGHGAWAAVVITGGDYAKDLYTSYKRWCGEAGERPETQRKFGERLRERGFQRDRGGSRGAGIWRGLRLSTEERARIEGMLTLQKSGISSNSDPTDPKTQFTGEKETRGSG